MKKLNCWFEIIFYFEQQIIMGKWHLKTGRVVILTVSKEGAKEVKFLTACHLDKL